MMGWELIHSRIATREHFFYRNPMLEMREKGCYCLFYVVVKTPSRHTEDCFTSVTSQH